MHKFYKRFKGYLHNIAWIVGDRSLAIAIGFFIAVLLARYLGPEQYGLLSYGLSLAALAGAAAHLGLSGLVVKEIVVSRVPQQRAEILGTTFGLKLVGAAVGYFSVMIYTSLVDGITSNEFCIVAISGLVIFYRAFDVVDIWFEASVKAKYSTIPKTVAIICGATIKVLMVVGGAGVIYFAAAHVIQFLIAALLLTISYVNTSSIKISQWKFSLKRSVELLSSGWMIYLGSIFAAVYLKVDQVMIKAILGNEAVGTYAIAAQISEAWYVLPAAIVATFFPRLIALHSDSKADFKVNLQNLFDILFTTAFFIAVLVSVCADWLVGSLFGSAYESSGSILVIHIWAALFVFLRAAFSKWILIENAFIFSIITQGAGAIANVALNFLLIPIYGGEGAAVATLFSYALASYFSLFFYTKTRPVFWQMTSAFTSPFKYSIRLVFGISSMK